MVIRRIFAIKSIKDFLSKFFIQIFAFFLKHHAHIRTNTHTLVFSWYTFKYAFIMM